jgi:hypothetical protein
MGSLNHVGQRNGKNMLEYLDEILDEILGIP